MKRMAARSISLLVSLSLVFALGAPVYAAQPEDIEDSSVAVDIIEETPAVAEETGPEAPAESTEEEPAAPEETSEAKTGEPEAGLAADEPADEGEASPAASNTVATALEVTLNDPNPPSYVLTTQSEIHWFKFTLPSNGVYTFSFFNADTTRGDGYGWDANLYYSATDANNSKAIDSYEFSNKLAEFSSAIDPVKIPNIGLPAGTYYISVKSHYAYGLNLSYKFRVGFEQRDDWETEPNDSHVAAKALTPGGANVYGNTISNTDQDWYKFTLPSDGVYSLTFGNQTSTDGYGWDVWLYFATPDAYNSTAVGAYSFENKLPSHGTLQLGLPAGDYYILVKSHYGYGVGLNYWLKVNFEGRSDWEKEWNDTWNKADPIPLGTMFYGVTSASDDQDWYSFTLNSAATVALTFNKPTDNGDSYGWNVNLYKGIANGYDSTALAKYSFETKTPTQAGDAIELAAGTYYIQVVSHYGYAKELAYSFVVGTAPVPETPPEPVAATGAKLNMAAKTLSVGGKVTLKAAVSPADTANKKVTWSSSNKKVATVSSSGKVTAVKNGTATITVKTANGKKATCKITVGGTAVSKVKVSSKTLKLAVGRSKTLKATFTPAVPTNKKVSWSSSDPSVATVSSKGKVTAVGSGTAKITVTTSDGAKTASCTVTVP